MAFTWDTAICVKYEWLVANVTVPRSRLKVTKEVVKALWKVKCDENEHFFCDFKGQFMNQTYFYMWLHLFTARIGIRNDEDKRCNILVFIAVLSRLIDLIDFKRRLGC